MPVKVTNDDAEFLGRVRAYCAKGLSEPAMAKAEATSITSVRNRLWRCGFTIAKQVGREIVRTGSGESLSELVAAGQLVVVEEEAASGIEEARVA